jgi:hypothetical protein
VAGRLIHALSFKSPRDFAESFKSIIGINLLEIPSYHFYIEIKATRDIHSHNNCIANNTYVTKAESHARVEPGQELPISNNYYLSPYEHCIRIIEQIERKYHEIWPSQDFINQQAKLEKDKA